MPRPVRSVLLAVFLLLVTAQQILAYTDPGSGILLLQIVGAAAVGCLFYVRRIFDWLSGKRKASRE